jgi:DUF971 family protein
MYPETIDQISDEVITIRWDDGHESIYFAEYLRKNCPCAICAGHEKKEDTSPFKMLKINSKNIKFTSWERIGRYAVGFRFSDGHKTGIYTYETLRSLCQCDLCDPDVIRIQGPLK